MHFVHPVPYISDLLLSSSANYEQIRETSLRTFSGLKIGTFHSLELLHCSRGQTSILPGIVFSLRNTGSLDCFILVYSFISLSFKIESLVLVYTVYIPYNRSKRTDMVLIAAD